MFEAPMRPGHLAVNIPPITGPVEVRSRSISSSHAVKSTSFCSVSVRPQGDRGDRGPRGTVGSPGPVGPAGAKVPPCRQKIVCI